MLLMSVMGLFGATLTMPGIAGIVLTLGMAVDANVLIFSRIRGKLKQDARFNGQFMKGMTVHLFPFWTETSPR